ncbi:hypothetical protein EW146_g3919 [Bondarzewia mesenterica]|uniref:Glutamine amidotransferase type-2 domain-containing protein n=1 Tax=Bondarzewia mesenterica TaxID=1095465 RepID=A0A4S4LWL1_9AGAM|nr:hypothetical protein EW146_g3919 [Bondarzewia mesenterica]
MCGIVFSARWTTNDAVSTSGTGRQDKFQKLKQRLHDANTARAGCPGPDAQRTRQVCIEGQERFYLDLEFFASELRLRGNAPVVQPHVDEERGDVLCWNGEIFEGLDIGPDENDGVKLFSAITSLEDLDDLPRLLETIEGPYAFVYYHHASHRLFYARDPLGRRSLLINKPTPKNPYFLLTSVSVGALEEYDLTEVSTDHIYSLDLQRLGASPDPIAGFENCLEGLQRVFNSSAFSGMTFCIIIKAEPSRVNRALPPSDLSSRLETLDEIPSYLGAAVEGLISHLDRSVMLRVRNIPQWHLTLEQKVEREAQFNSARVAVLFSGGIDSTVIAFLAHRHLPLDEPIDLLNVAFENPRKLRVSTTGNVGGFTKKQKKEQKRYEALGEGRNEKYDHDYLVPDRVTGLKEVEELRRLCPGRTWNFVEVDVPYAESQAARPVVEAIMWPGRTVMDLSLAMALYFAARGIGQVRSDANAAPIPYTSPARVLLNGLGSDELLGGYGRHRTAFNTGGWQAVIEELQLEIDRIPTRNLGRDDRVISSHGKESRHPFLSLNVVAFLAALPVHFKMDPRQEVGLGDKMLLRLAARKLGLVEASARKKRAMQFGSHSARMEAGIGDGGGQLLLS